jgi:cytochrome c5
MRKPKLIVALVMSLCGIGLAQAGDAGKLTYDAKCAACHNSGAAGAPKLGDAAAWSGRIAAGSDALMASVINGKNAMPPRGACTDCSDADLKAALEYLVSASK